MGHLPLGLSTRKVLTGYNTASQIGALYSCQGHWIPIGKKWKVTSEISDCVKGSTSSPLKKKVCQPSEEDLSRLFSSFSSCAGAILALISPQCDGYVPVSLAPSMISEANWRITVQSCWMQPLLPSTRLSPPKFFLEGPGSTMVSSEPLSLLWIVSFCTEDVLEKKNPNWHCYRGLQICKWWDSEDRLLVSSAVIPIITSDTLECKSFPHSAQHNKHLIALYGRGV